MSFQSKCIWHSIYNNFHPARRWPSIAMGIVIASFLFFMSYLNANGSNKNIASIQLPDTQPKIIIVNNKSKGLLSFTNTFSFDNVKEQFKKHFYR